MGIEFPVSNWRKLFLQQPKEDFQFSGAKEFVLVPTKKFKQCRSEFLKNVRDVIEGDNINPKENLSAIFDLLRKNDKIKELNTMQMNVIGDQESLLVLIMANKDIDHFIPYNYPVEGIKSISCIQNKKPNGNVPVKSNPNIAKKETTPNRKANPNNPITNNPIVNNPIVNNPIVNNPIVNYKCNICGNLKTKGGHECTPTT